VLAAALGLSLLTPAVAPAAPATGSLRLTYQSPWVDAAGDFTMRLRIERPDGPSNLEVAVTVYPPVATRSEFAITLKDQANGAALLPAQVFPLADLAPDAAGEVTVPLHLQDRLSIGHDDGVFPVRVDLRERGTGRVLQRFTTHLVYLPSQHVGAKLGVSLVLPMHAAPGLPASGARQLHGIDALSDLPAAIDALRGTPAAISPTPETLATLAASPDERASTLLKALQQRVPAMTLLAGTYVPTSLPALVAAGLQQDVTTQVARGSATVSEVLRARPDARTWLAQDPLDDASLSTLAGRGIDRVLVPETGLAPMRSQKLTLTQPFLLQSREHQVQAVVADSALSGHFDDKVDPVLAANHLLADLAVVYLDQPGADRRAVVAVAPRSWSADRRFLDTAVSGLSQNPILDTLSLDALFSTVAPARSEEGRPLVRSLAPPPAPALADVTADLRTARRRLNALGSVLGAAPAHALLEERLLLAESSELRTTRQRQPYVDAVRTGVDAQVHDIRMPSGQSITLTARKGEIPITFQNRTGVPAKVIVKVQSDKLVFPRGSSQMLDLARRNTTERLSVESRTSGAFPVRITLESPDGALVIDQARLTIRSTATSGLSLAVSSGAALFLAIWWYRHALRGRRARRLVPA
jgi:hypothetical protein